ncbi:MAG TPA: glycosyltransferase [Longimicrobium sp.]|nr:glycosyltransferase [Longimicrobium sp.]
MAKGLRILVVTSEWPTPAHPGYVPYLVQEVACLGRAGVEVDVFAFRGRKNPLRYLWAWMRLRRRLARARYDVVHAHFGQSGVVALGAPAPLVVTFHGSDLHGIVGRRGRGTAAGWVLRRVSGFVARRADAVVVVSPHMAALLPPGVHCEVVPSGVDFRRFAPAPRDAARRRLGLPDGVPLALFAGAPGDPVKRHALAAEVVRRVRLRRPLEMVVLDGVPHAEVPHYLNACDLLLVTSAHEGSPTAVKEALACGLPVVSVDVGDVARRLAGVEGCHLCAGGTAGELARAVTAVLERRGRVDGRAAVADVGAEALALRLARLYARLAGRPADQRTPVLAGHGPTA